MTPLSDAAIAAWPTYAADVVDRLRAGRDTYGDASFTASLKSLCGEIKCECKDIAGWGYVLYSRIDDLERRIEEFERRYALAERQLKLGISDVVMEQVLQQRTDDDK